MRHHKSGRKLTTTSSHRKSIFINMSISLFKHGYIKTTLPKAKELRRFVEPIITIAKKDFLLREQHNIKNYSTHEKSKLNMDIVSKIVYLRRRVFRLLCNKVVLKKLFHEIAPLFRSRNGGYTSILKSGYRSTDKAPMAYIRLVQN